MNSSLYIGATGMKGLAQGMQVTSNNLANVSTIGFKKQDIQFSDLISQDQAGIGNWWNNQENSMVAIGQVGMGLAVNDVRTLFTEGGKESTNIMTDLAISGKGFFQVSDDSGNLFYTRAGDFQSDNEGVWRNPAGLALNGHPVNADGTLGELANVQIDRFGTLPPRATTSLEMSVNLSDHTDKSGDSENPFFSLLENYDATATTPLGDNQYTKSQAITIYDADGNTHQVTAYFDGVSPDLGSRRYMEFVIASNELPTEDAEGNPIERNEGDGLLMAGVLEFDASGNLVNVAAFTPEEAGSKDLSQWTVAQMNEGKPVLSLDGASMDVNFGLSGSGDWVNAPASAADVASDPNLLPGLGGETVKAEFPCTAYQSGTFTDSYKQNGYGEGSLSTLAVSGEGRITGSYSNGQTVDLWQIPLARFTSEDGLYRDGGNLFVATEESGEMTLGQPGTENYGKVLAYNLETSNVDLATEFVNMIVNQRGFQSNSKVVTTADALLQTAVQLKRS